MMGDVVVSRYGDQTWLLLALLPNQPIQQVDQVVRRDGWLGQHFQVLWYFRQALCLESFVLCFLSLGPRVVGPSSEFVEFHS